MKKCLTQRFPFLLPLRKKQRKIFFYLKMKWDKESYAREQRSENLPYEISTGESTLINPHTGYDLQYQYNKVYNLKLAAAAINGLVIKPQESFSFCLAARYADKRTPYKDGLHLIGGKVATGYGGGLCQLSNLLYWLFLHSPLTITERHGHATENFKPIEKNGIVGVDATINEGWLDLKVKNNTSHCYQIKITFTESQMTGALLSDKPKEWEYLLFNPYIRYQKEQGEVIQKAMLCRRQTHLFTSQVREETLYENSCRIAYDRDEVAKEKNSSCA